MDHALRAYRAASKRLGREPVVPYLANGYWRRSTLPLVQPWRMTYRHRDGITRKSPSTWLKCFCSSAVPGA